MKKMADYSGDEEEDEKTKNRKKKSAKKKKRKVTNIKDTDSSDEIVESSSALTVPRPKGSVFSPVIMYGSAIVITGTPDAAALQVLGPSSTVTPDRVHFEPSQFHMVFWNKGVQTN